MGDEQEYRAAFERFEYLCCLIYQDEYKHRGYYGSGPVGLWAYRARHRGGGPVADVAREIEAQREGWALLRAGLFGVDPERLRQMKQETDEHVQRAIAGNW